MQHVVFAGEHRFVRQADEALVFQFGGADGGGNVFVRFAIENLARDGVLQDDRFMRAGDDNPRA